MNILILVGNLEMWSVIIMFEVISVSWTLHFTWLK